MKSFSELTSASQVNNGDLLAISQTSGSGYASKKTTVKEITDKSNLNLAEEYDSTSTYAVDDYVIYESVLYKCIASTTGTFDSTKWTSVVVTDEMGSGGGGGTGGHTIIDENGTSMTARAGLQFVGANVDDDATNNKTIVDLASAGGIDGVFIDTENVITTLTGTGTESFADYLATEDCFVIGTITGAANCFPAVQIDGITVAYINNSTNTIGICVSAKKGQTISYRMSSQSTLTVYGIQTGTTHSKFQPVIYSTEEREVGVWTDGKPLYQKTYTVPTSSAQISYNNWTNVGIDVSFVDTMVKAFGIALDGSFQGDFLTWNDNGTLKLQSGRNGNNAYANTLTIQYTKSSDTAGSGSWTPQGVPTHHYSTDEQVIGTWIDGSTLYEKTLTGLNISVANDWSSVFGGSLNIEMLVDAILYDTQVSANPIVVDVSDKQVLNGGIRINNAQSTSRVITMAVLQYTKSS